MLLNNDAEAEPGMLAALQAAAERHPRAGVLAGQAALPRRARAVGGPARRAAHGLLRPPARARAARRLRLLGRGPHGPRGRRADGGLARGDRARGAARRGPVRLRRGRRLVAADPRGRLRVRVRAGARAPRTRHRLDRRRGRRRTTVYYGTRNTIVVCERHLPARAPSGLRVRRACVLGGVPCPCRAGAALAARRCGRCWRASATLGRGGWVRGERRLGRSGVRAARSQSC